MDLGARGGAPAPSGSPNGISTISCPKIALNANFYVSPLAANTDWTQGSEVRPSLHPHHRQGSSARRCLAA